MKPKADPKAEQDDPAQSRRFIDMAHEVEATDDPATFDTAFKKVTHSTSESLSTEDKAGET